jgi:hypothetical protein
MRKRSKWAFRLRNYNLTHSRWLALDVTTADVKANCEDLKVLGKGDFKALLKWRTGLREEVSEASLGVVHRSDTSIS